MKAPMSCSNEGAANVNVRLMYFKMPWHCHNINNTF